MTQIIKIELNEYSDSSEWTDPAVDIHFDNNDVYTVQMSDLKFKSSLG